MQSRKPVVHLVCNAHIDPIWMWHWEEGAREAISTFRTAADFLDEFPDFVFNHNETVLYEWVEEYDPALFARIRRFVKDGRWNLAGGWYIQPDCNMPGGETFVRLISTGLRYFKDRFGVRPKVAYNFDPFGHNGSLPQLLRQSGYELYIHCRPSPHMLELPAPLYRWKGLDGSEIRSLRPATGWYGTFAGTAADSVRRGVEEARKTGKDSLVTWGLGDHGGGPTRKDMAAIQALQAEVTDVEIRHSTPEAFLASLEPVEKYPQHKGDLQRSFAGCYTSISQIKRGMRRGEALLRSAETWAALAWWRNGDDYPKAALTQAWKGVLFNTFHDILPGSTLQAAVQDVLEIFGRSADICRRIRLKGQLALLPNVSPTPGTIPVYVSNPHASTMTAPVAFEFLASSMPAPTREPFALYDDLGKKIASQDEGGPFEQSKHIWQRHLSFVADVPALSVRRYEIKLGETPAQSRSPLIVKEMKTQIAVENRWVKAKFLRATGGLASLLDKRTGRDLLKGSVLPVVMKDNLDAWGGDANVVFSTPIGAFKPLAPEEVAKWHGSEGVNGPSLNVLYQGGVSVTVESLLGWDYSRVSQQITLYADSPCLDANLRVHWQERGRCLKWVLPFRLQESRAICEVPFAAIERVADGTEHVGGRWVRLEEKAGDKLAVGVANNGQYGFHARENGELSLSLLRGAVHCRFGEQPAKAGEHHNYMDQGQHDFRFRLVWGKAPAVASALVPAAMELNLPLEAFFVYNQPTPRPDAPIKMAPLFEVSPATVTLSALKQAEDGNGLILRLNETIGKPTKAKISVAGLAAPTKVELRGFEVMSFRLSKEKGKIELRPCGLLEE